MTRRRKTRARRRLLAWRIAEHGANVELLKSLEARGGRPPCLVPLRPAQVDPSDFMKDPDHRVAALTLSMMDRMLEDMRPTSSYMFLVSPESARGLARLVRKVQRKHERLIAYQKRRRRK